MGESSESQAGLRRVIRVVAPVREQLWEILRDAILTGEYAPGARLIERELCERTGASRASVREAKPRSSCRSSHMSGPWSRS
jgi:hypothetical protein